MFFKSTIAAAVAVFAATSQAAAVRGSSSVVGAAFAMTNAAPQNAIIAFDRLDNGHLNPTGTYWTNGTGLGVDLDTQGGVRLSKDNRFLYAVNAASDEISVFSVTGSKLKLIQTVYGGDEPLSLTINSNNDVLYALVGSVAGNGITGFQIQKDGTLKAIANSFLGLSSPIAVPGDIEFSAGGDYIVVTHKVGSNLDVFSVGADGTAKGPLTFASSGPRPFAATFGKDNTLYVIESGLPSIGNAAVSTYSLDTSNGALTAVTRSVKNGQTDGCWIVLSAAQDFAYTANFVSGTISSYSISNGAVTLINAAAGTPGDNSQPTDLALTPDGKFIYDLLRGTGAVNGWAVNADGSLTELGNFGANSGIPVSNGASGLAVY